MISGIVVSRSPLSVPLDGRSSRAGRGRMTAPSGFDAVGDWAHKAALIPLTTAIVATARTRNTISRRFVR
jgi:hypothetical protein